MSTAKFFTDEQGRKRPVSPQKGTSGPRRYKAPASFKIEETVKVQEEEPEQETEEDSKVSPGKASH